MPDTRITTITPSVISNFAQEAGKSPRQRKQRNMHEVEDSIQRIVRAFQPGTYMQPHRNLGEAQFRLFVVLQGSVGVVYFKENGETQEATVLSKENGNFAIEVAGDQFFSMVCIEPDSAILEVREGPIQKDVRETLAGFPDEMDFLTSEPGSEKRTRIEALVEKVERRCQSFSKQPQRLKNT